MQRLINEVSKRLSACADMNALTLDAGSAPGLAKAVAWTVLAIPLVALLGLCVRRTATGGGRSLRRGESGIGGEGATDGGRGRPSARKVADGASALFCCLLLLLHAIPRDERPAGGFPDLERRYGWIRDVFLRDGPVDLEETYSACCHGEIDDARTDALIDLYLSCDEGDLAEAASLARKTPTDELVRALLDLEALDDAGVSRESLCADPPSPARGRNGTRSRDPSFRAVSFPGGRPGCCVCYEKQGADLGRQGTSSLLLYAAAVVTLGTPRLRLGPGSRGAFYAVSLCAFLVPVLMERSLESRDVNNVLRPSHVRGNLFKRCVVMYRYSPAPHYAAYAAAAHAAFGATCAIVESAIVAWKARRYQ
jgi:hypothetical protein